MHRKSAYILFLAVLGMLVIGIVMLFSTSAFARTSHGDVYYFIKRQSLWLGIGLAGCVVATVVDYHFWRRTWCIWFALATVVLALCFVPHLGMRINGSRRWVGIGPVAFQPSEVAKVASQSWTSTLASRHSKTSPRGQHHIFAPPPAEHLQSRQPPANLASINQRAHRQHGQSLSIQESPSSPSMKIRA